MFVFPPPHSYGGDKSTWEKVNSHVQAIANKVIVVSITEGMAEGRLSHPVRTKEGLSCPSVMGCWGFSLSFSYLIAIVMANGEEEFVY